MYKGHEDVCIKDKWKWSGSVAYVNTCLLIDNLWQFCHFFFFFFAAFKLSIKVRQWVCKSSNDLEKEIKPTSTNINNTQFRPTLLVPFIKKLWIDIICRRIYTLKPSLLINLQFYIRNSYNNMGINKTSEILSLKSLLHT